MAATPTAPNPETDVGRMLREYFKSRLRFEPIATELQTEFSKLPKAARGAYRVPTRFQVWRKGPVDATLDSLRAAQHQLTDRGLKEEAAAMGAFADRYEKHHEALSAMFHERKLFTKGLKDNGFSGRQSEDIRVDLDITAANVHRGGAPESEVTAIGDSLARMKPGEVSKGVAKLAQDTTGKFATEASSVVGETERLAGNGKGPGQIVKAVEHEGKSFFGRHWGKLAIGAAGVAVGGYLLTQMGKGNETEQPQQPPQPSR